MPGACRCGSNDSDLGVLLQHRVGVQLLVGFHRLDVDVDAVAEAAPRAAVRRLVALREELEADLEMRLRVAAVRVQVDRVEHDARAGLQQPAGIVGSKKSALRPTSCTGQRSAVVADIVAEIRQLRRGHRRASRSCGGRRSVPPTVCAAGVALRMSLTSRISTADDVAVFGERRSAPARISPHQSGALRLHGDLVVVETIRSGVPMRPLGAVAERAAAAACRPDCPRGAPLSAHFAIFAISCVAQRRDRSCTSGCRCSSRCTTAASRRACGRCRVRCLIARAHGRTSS